MAQAKLKLTPVVVDDCCVVGYLIDQISIEGKRKKEQLVHIRNTMNYEVSFTFPLKKFNKI